MNYLKTLIIAAGAAMALTAFTASTAGATTLAIGGSAVNKSVSIESSLASGTSMVISRTDGSLANTCTQSSMAGSTVSPFTTEDVEMPISTETFTACERSVVVHKKGSWTYKWIGGLNLTAFWGESEVTVGSPFGTLNCKTGAPHIHFGTVTGKIFGRTLWHINAVINCGFLVPSAVWKGTYEITSPEGLGGVE